MGERFKRNGLLDAFAWKIKENPLSSKIGFHMYDISVAIPTLNSAKYLENTLFSLVHQTGCSVDVIVVDSGSEDDTLNICEKYSIRTIYISPGNMYSAINKGLAACESPWLCYINSDDTIYPTSFARLIRHGESQTADVVYGGCDFIDEEGRYMHSFSPGKPAELKSHFHTFEMSFAQPSAIFRQKVFKQLNGFNDSYHLISDFDFYFRAITSGQKFAMLEGKTVCSFRISTTQIGRKIDQMKEEISQIRHDFAKPTLKDLWLTMFWKIRNWPNYLIRLLRYKVLTNEFRLIRATDVYEEKS